MGKKLLIVVEGHTDKDFIELYAKHLGLELGEKDVQPTGGKDNIQSKAEWIKPALNKGKRVLIIFDADDDCEKSREHIKEQLNELGVDSKKCEIFLMPNDSDFGTLESLLEEIATKKCILKCFDNYVSCIKKVKNENIRTPTKKSKVFAYLSSFGFKNGIKNFQLNDDMFNLKHPYLDKLKNFLKAHDENVS